MKIYTRTGDSGDTGLFGGARVSKAGDRVDAYGEVDELNSHLGRARAAGLTASVEACIFPIQSELFDVGAELSTAPAKRDAPNLPRIDDESVLRLETMIDSLEKGLPPLTTFVLPGGSPTAAELHVARCVCRRAERRVVALSAAEEVRPVLLRYLNRLSDLLFTAARRENAEREVADVPWVGRDRFRKGEEPAR